MLAPLWLAMAQFKGVGDHGSSCSPAGPLPLTQSLGFALEATGLSQYLEAPDPAGPHLG